MQRYEMVEGGSYKAEFLWVPELQLQFHTKMLRTICFGTEGVPYCSKTLNNIFGVKHMLGK